MPQVKIGDRDYELAGWTPYKAFEAGEVLNQIFEEVPEIADDQAKFRNEYRRLHVDELNRAQVEFRYPQEAARMTDDAWERAGGVLSFPIEPKTEELVVKTFPRSFKLARDKVTLLLAIALCPNSVLEEADKNQMTTADAVAEYKKALLHRATLPQLVALAAAVVRQIGDEMAETGDDLGNLMGALGWKISLPWAPSSDAPNGTPSDGARKRRSGSAKRSAGRAKKSSTASGGVSSAPSAAS